MDKKQWEALLEMMESQAVTQSAGQSVTQAPITSKSPVEIDNLKKDLQVAVNNPNTQISVGTDDNKAELHNISGLVKDPDDPNNIQIAVKGATDKDLELVQLDDIDLVEDEELNHIIRLSKD